MNLPAHKKMLSAAAAVSVMLITAACGSGSDGDGTTPTSSAPSSSSSAGSSDSSATFKDGDYEATVSYANPAGSSELGVKVTLAANKITAVEVTPEASDGTSKSYQEMFAGGISGEVVGKAIDGLEVSTVAGSSFTPDGFNKALDEIRADAKP